MTASELLSTIFDKGLQQGINFLSEDERDLFYIQDFIIEYEMNGLSGYFYNRLVDRKLIGMTISAMNDHGLFELGQYLKEAFDIFDHFKESKNDTSWEDILATYDPNNNLEAISQQIDLLDNYGLERSTIQSD